MGSGHHERAYLEEGGLGVWENEKEFLRTEISHQKDIYNEGEGFWDMTLSKKGTERNRCEDGLYCVDTPSASNWARAHLLRISDDL